MPQLFPQHRHKHDSNTLTNWLGVEPGTWSPPLSGEAARYWVLLGGPRSTGTGSNDDVVTVNDACCLLSWRCCWQDFTACMGLLGPVLGTIQMEFSDDNIPDSESLRSLWACHNLRSLKLVSYDIKLRAEDINAGLQHLRFGVCCFHSSDLVAPPMHN